MSNFHEKNVLFSIRIKVRCTVKITEIVKTIQKLLKEIDYGCFHRSENNLNYDRAKF